MQTVDYLLNLVDCQRDQDYPQDILTSSGVLIFVEGEGWTTDKTGCSDTNEARDTVKGLYQKMWTDYIEGNLEGE